MALKSIFAHTLIQPLMMASTVEAAEAVGSISGTNEVVGEELPEGYDSWEAYRVAQQAAPGTDTTPAAEGVDTTEGASQTEETPAEETPEQKEARAKEMVRLSTEGMAPEMAEKVTPFVESFAKNGTLTEIEIKEAAKATGFSEAMIVQYMEGALYRTEKSAAEATQAEAALVKPFYEAFGGQDRYAAFSEWVDKGGISKEEATAYNEALDKSPAAALELAKVYKARMESSGSGADPTDLTRGAQGGGSGEDGGYASSAEMEADMNDPRYKSDPAFRAKVAAKVGKSNF